MAKDYASGQSHAVLFLIKEPKSRQRQCFYAQAFSLQAVATQARTRPTHLTASPEAVSLSEKIITKQNAIDAVR